MKVPTSEHVSRRKTLILFFVALGGLCIAMSIPIQCSEEQTTVMDVKPLDLGGFSAAGPARPLRLLFIHHSCGGQWLAPQGPDRGGNCIYESAVNGGGLRDRLIAEGYEVHEASYGTLVGSKTDVFDWLPKFRGQMDEVLRCDHQDRFYSEPRRNDIVVFKPCFPNNQFLAAGQPPGNPEGPELTFENAVAAYKALLPEFEKQPKTLFVAVTAPPLAVGRVPLYRLLARRLLGRPDLRRSGPYARAFNNWLKDSETGWLSDYRGKNVVVFDLYDVLTDYGVSNFSRYPTGRLGEDSHPSAEGNRKATEAFVPFLNQVVRRAGLAE